MKNPTVAETIAALRPNIKADETYYYGHPDIIAEQACAHLERLSVENERLRAALEQIARAALFRKVSA